MDRSSGRTLLIAFIQVYWSDLHCPKVCWQIWHQAVTYFIWKALRHIFSCKHNSRNHQKIIVIIWQLQQTAKGGGGGQSGHITEWICKSSGDDKSRTPIHTCLHSESGGRLWSGEFVWEGPEISSHLTLNSYIKVFGAFLNSNMLFSKL